MRVNAGRARGRLLRVPRTTIRPTADKVKQAIFSMLEAEAQRRGFVSDDDPETGEIRFAAAQAWPRVLDLFAGSGALGIEALSRGAQSADFIERDRVACDAIQANLNATGLAPCGRVIRGSADVVLGSASQEYDLVLLDPPYGDIPAATSALGRIGTKGLLSPRGIICWEHDRARADDSKTPGLRVLRQRDHGSTRITLLEADPGPEHVAYELNQ